MSIYDRMQNSSANKETCNECKKDYTWSVESDHYPGNKMTEHVICPHCGERNRSIRTSGFVFTSKIEE